jgi:hypothetical protein
MKSDDAIKRWQAHKCACVHPDGRECARLRDRLDPEEWDFGQRACECCGHDEMDDEDDDPLPTVRYD